MRIERASTAAHKRTSTSSDLPKSRLHSTQKNLCECLRERTGKTYGDPERRVNRGPVPGCDRLDLRDVGRRTFRLCDFATLKLLECGGESTREYIQAQQGGWSGKRQGSVDNPTLFQRRGTVQDLHQGSQITVAEA